MSQHPIVKPGQRWRSVRNNEEVEVVSVRENTDDDGHCAQIQTATKKRWIGCGLEGIKGYRLIQA
jgi:hypothetical protein